MILPASLSLGIVKYEQRVEGLGAELEAELELAEQLDPKERVELADELLHSVAVNDEDEDDVDADSALHPDWERELQQRMDDVEHGRAELVSWTDAKASLQKVIASSRRRG